MTRIKHVVIHKSLNCLPYRRTANLVFFAKTIFARQHATFGKLAHLNTAAQIISYLYI